MAEEKTLSKRVENDYYSNGVSLIRNFNDITIIDDMLECLNDMGYLNEEGEEFQRDFWEEWIKEDEDKE